MGRSLGCCAAYLLITLATRLGAENVAGGQTHDHSRSEFHGRNRITCRLPRPGGVVVAAHHAHVRVDLIRENLAFRKKAWLELFGITFFLIPFTLTILYFAIGYAYGAFSMNEQSTSTVGLTHRWIIKSVLVFGLMTVVTAGIAVWLQVVLVLFGDPARRFRLMTFEWPEEDAKIEGKERVKLEEAPDTLVAPDDALRERTSKILTGG